MILSNLSCSKIFGKLTGKRQWPLLQSLALATPSVTSLGGNVVNKYEIFQNLEN